MFRPSPYEALQVLPPEERELSGKERLLLASGPLLSWYRREKRDLPWRENRDPYRIWISEIMLQQTRVAAVLDYYRRARNIKKAAEILTEKYNGSFPESYEEILALPGIGSYTAGAIASIAFELPVPAVDGNVLRVLSRVTGSFDDILKQSTKKKMEALISEVIQPGSAGDFNQALIETGAMICIPGGAPLCSQCPFFTVCAARSQGLTEKLPVKTPKKKRKTEEKTVLLLEYQDKIAIRKRREDGLLASLYEFVNVPGQLSAEEAGALLDQEVRPEPLPEAKHIFSHVEWRMRGFAVELQEKPTGDYLWVTPEEIRETYSLPSAFKAYTMMIR